MGSTAHTLAIKLRQSGASIKEIARKLAVAQSTVSLWVRDVPISDSALVARSNGNIKKAHMARREQREARYDAYYNAAVRAWSEFKGDPEFMFGLALYIGEGAKTDRHTSSVSNCDPRVIRKAIAFFELIGAERDNILASIHIHDDAAVTAARAFWAGETGLPEQQFRKTVVAVSGASSRSKIGRQPHGTCHVFVHSTELRQKIERWMTLALNTNHLTGS